MAKAKKQAKKQNDSSEESDDESPAERKKFMVIGLAVVALLVGGYVFTSGGGETADAAAAPEEPVEVVPGEVVPLEPITLNLADGRYLKVGIALQLIEGVPVPAEAEIAGYAAPALDDAISLLGALTYDQLAAPGGRDAAKASLSEKVAARYVDEVMGIYFTELVMQ